MAVCLECEVKCLSCKNTADFCMTCIDSSRSNAPGCECSDGFYTDLDNGDCL